MAVASNAIVNFMNLGVRGVKDPAPDGLFAADDFLAGDASGGTAVIDLLIGNSNSASPDDIMMKLSWVSFGHDAGAALVQGSIRMVAQLPHRTSGADIRLVNGHQAQQSGITFAPANGVWFFPGKDVTFFLRGVADNIGVGTDYRMSCQGEYWYMGRLRQAMDL